MAGLVGPIVFGKGDDRGYFGVAELLPGRHAAVVLAIEQNSYLFVFVGVKNHSRAVQGLDRTDSFAIGLVAGGAIGGIDFFAAQRDFFYSPDFGRVIRFGGKFFLFCADPGAVVFGRHHFHMDGHVGMLLAAQLNALAVVITDFFGPKPGVADKAGNCVLFDAKRWHHKAVNHIIGGADMFAAAFGGAPVLDISGRLPDVIGDDPMGAFELAAGRFGEATQQPGAMEQVIELPFGPMTGRTFLRFVAFDLTVHTWDVASVTGSEVEFPEELLVEITSFAHHVLDAVPRSELLCADPVESPPGASPLEVLVAYSGRQL